jgi:hypothetical protein
LSGNLEFACFSAKGSFARRMFWSHQFSADIRSPADYRTIGPP